MRIFKQNIAKISFLFFSVIFFATRLYNLDSLPIFTDEAIYIRWSQIIRSVETLRFLPQAAEGKQPLFMWLSIPFMKVIQDPLIATRTLSIASGFGVFLGCWLIIGLINFKNETKNPLIYLMSSIEKNIQLKIILSFFFITNTYTLFFDRLASADTLLSMFLVFAVLVSLIQQKYYRLDLSLILGGILGLAWLTKSPATIYYSLITTYLVLLANNKPKAILLSAISGIVMLSIYSILRLGPQFNMIAFRTSGYVYPYSHILSSPLDPFRPHFMALLSIYSFYINIFIFSIGLFFSLFSMNKNKIFILILWFLPTLGVLTYTKVLTSRYVLFAIPYLIILLTYGWNELIIKSKYFLGILILLLSIQLSYSYKLISNPFTAQIPINDTGYINEWTAGWGMQEISKFFIKEAKTGKNIIVASEGNFGNPKDALQVYTNNINGITVVPQEVFFTTIPDSMKKAKQSGDEVYFVYNSNRVKLQPEALKSVQIISSYPKPDGTSFQVFKLL